MAYLGFDTSNYTTSAAVYYPETGRIETEKMLLPVREGEKGLRQSDAVFHHTYQLPKVLSALAERTGFEADGVCASVAPCPREGSYMPCFLVGKGAAVCTSLSARVPLFFTTHQHGHIAAALYSANRLELIHERFLAFHLSGGTTEALIVEPDSGEIFRPKVVASSLDLKAGQAVDRVGLMLSMSFPCGAELDRMARQSNRSFKIRPSMKGDCCSLSGVENKCRAMLEKGEPKEDVARFCIEYISASLDEMTLRLREKYGNLPLVYSGGVMSNSIISARFKEKYNAVFAKPEFSSDNAAGVAIIGYLKSTEKKF